MNAVSSSIFSTQYLSPLTSRSLSSVSSTVAENEAVEPPSDAVSARLIGNDLRAQAAVTGVARSGAEDRSSFLSTAVTDLGVIQALLQEADTLAESLQDNSNTGDLQRAFAQDDYDALLSDITETATNSEFDGVSLLNADQEVSFQVGTGTEAEDEITVQLLSAQLDSLASGLSTSGFSSDADVTAARDLLQEAISSVEGQINNLEGSEDRVEAASQASLATISGLNAAFQAQLEYQQALVASAGDDTTSAQISDQIQAYLQIVALDFNEVSAAEAAFKVHFDLDA